MKIGPFDHRDIEDVQKILETASVPFEITIDRELMAEKTRRFQTGITHIRTTIFDGSFFYAEVADAYVSEIGDRLEKFGILLQPSAFLDNESLAPKSNVISFHSYAKRRVRSHTFSYSAVFFLSALAIATLLPLCSDLASNFLIFIAIHTYNSSRIETLV